MQTFKTLENSLKTKEVVVISIKDFEYKGVSRKSIKARKAKGKRVYYVTQYENGTFSEAV